MSARVLVAGIGNIFLGDDGFGVEVVRRLAELPARPDVIIADIGIRTLHLSYALLDRPGLLLVVDAVSRGEPPGTLYVIDGTPATTGDGPSIPDAHGMNLQTVLNAVSTLGGQPPPLRIVGCEPAYMGERLGLSRVVKAAVPRAVELVQREIDRGLRDAQELRTAGELNHAAGRAAEETEP
jgi:hydrogenase maturation protease